MQDNTATNLDLISLYAFLTPAMETTRASWRGFLSFFLTHLVELDADSTDFIVSSSITENPDDVIGSDANNPTTIPARVRLLSSDLAQLIGMGREFGLAALLDSSPPTKTHQLASKNGQVKQEELIAIWLARLQELQSEGLFQALMIQWREGLASILENGGLATEAFGSASTIENAESVEDSESIEDKDNDLPQSSQTDRKEEEAETEETLRPAITKPVPVPQKKKGGKKSVVNKDKRSPERRKQPSASNEPRERRTRHRSKSA